MIVRETGNIRKGIYCVGLAVVFITICSTSSPIYPLNMWNDANCFFTVGKSMLDGKVVYADIYEQKGILLYFLHAVAAMVSYDTFLGVWIMEIAAFSLFLFFAAKTAELFIDTGRAYLVILPVLSLIILTDKAFYLGDSAEELVLPLYMMFIYEYTQYFTQAEVAFQKKAALTGGALIGCVFWIKFNLIGFFAGFIISVIISMTKKKAYLECLKYIGRLAAGFAGAAIPWVIYFGANEAVDDWIYNYFYANTSLYSVSYSPMNMIVFIKDSFMGAVGASGAIMIPGIAGLFFLMLGNGVIMSKIGRTGFVLSYVLTAAGVWIGGRAHVYYVLAFAVFALFGLIAVYRGVETVHIRACSAKGAHKLAAYVIALHMAACAFAYWGANAADIMWLDSSRIAQYQFAEVINSRENATLLNYGSLDGGFYTAAGVVPSCKYFCMTNNAALTEMAEQQDKYVKQGVTDYVVTCSAQEPPEFLTENYSLVGEKGETYGPAENIYRLYERKW